MSEKQHMILASDKDFDELMDYVRLQQESKSGQFQTVSCEDGFSTIIGQMVEYDSKVFLDKAEFYLNAESMDLVQAGEKIWGSVIYALKKTYLAIGVDVASHAANRALFKLASKVYDSDTTGDLVETWSLFEKCHDNFYGQSLHRDDIKEALAAAKFAVEKLEKMDLQSLRINFNKEKSQPKDLSKIEVKEFKNPYTKIHGGVKYSVKIKCH
uniref:Uncharacterized protein n=1 Tax=Ditylenchus dipsaci TaxID=166011 RepID=A0A915EMG8_9BILA